MSGKRVCRKEAQTKKGKGNKKRKIEHSKNNNVASNGLKKEKTKDGLLKGTAKEKTTKKKK